MLIFWRPTIGDVGDEAHTVDFFLKFAWHPARVNGYSIHHEHPGQGIVRKSAG